MKKYLLTDIYYDISPEDVINNGEDIVDSFANPSDFFQNAVETIEALEDQLPSQLIVDIDSEKIDPGDNFVDLLTDEIYQKTGFLVKGFNYKEIKAVV